MTAPVPSDQQESAANGRGGSGHYDPTVSPPSPGVYAWVT
jgi:hypothetical protein